MRNHRRRPRLRHFFAHAGGVVMLLNAHPAAAQSVTFTATSIPLQGGPDSGPTCIAVADVNGDGSLDEVVSNYGFRWGLPGDPGGWNNTLEVLINNGSGVFTHHATLTVGKGPTSVIAADVNADGKPDLMLANFRDGTLTVLTNTCVFPPADITPTLTIRTQGNLAQVTWPSVSPGWSLQRSSDLAAGHWLPCGYGGETIAADVTYKSLTLPMHPGKLFLRLIHP